MEGICILLLSSRSWLFPRCLIWPSQLHVIILDDAKMSGCCSHICSLKFTLSYTKREKKRWSWFCLTRLWRKLLDCVSWLLFLLLLNEHVQCEIANYKARYKITHMCEMYLSKMLFLSVLLFFNNVALILPAFLLLSLFSNCHRFSVISTILFIHLVVQSKTSPLIAL